MISQECSIISTLSSAGSGLGGRAKGDSPLLGDVPTNVRFTTKRKIDITRTSAAASDPAAESGGGLGFGSDRSLPAVLKKLDERS